MALTPLSPYLVIAFDMDGVLTNYPQYKESLLDYYRWFLNFPDLTEEDYRKFLVANYYEGIQSFCEKHGLKNPYRHQEIIDQKENLNRLATVEKAREEAGMYPEMDQVLKIIKKKENIKAALNTSAVSDLVLSSLGNEIFKFSYLGIGNNDANVPHEDFYGKIPRYHSRSKLRKFVWICQKNQIDKRHMVFFTDTIGDVKEALAFGLQPHQIFIVPWGVHQKSDFAEHMSEIYPRLNFIRDVEEILEALAA
jgi:phosphoglycolate phosphatase-like HAD superfamily hydrolase